MKAGILISLSIALILLGSCTESPTPPEKPDEAEVMKQFQRLPLSFQENKGQVDNVVKFFVKNGAATTFFTPEEVVYSITEDIATESTENPSERAREEESIRQLIIIQSFLGANKNPEISGTDKLLGKVNYLIGNDEDKWTKDIDTYAKIHYKDLYPGIDLSYSGTRSGLHYTYLIQPNANYKDINISMEGIKKLVLNKNGTLIIQTALENIGANKPTAYQLINNEKKIIEVSYKLTSDNSYTFELGPYDKTLSLNISS